MSPKAKSINLDQLQGEVEKLLALLIDRQPGMMSWNQCLGERLDGILALIAEPSGPLTPNNPILIPALPAYSVADRRADTTKPKLYLGGQFKKEFLGQDLSGTAETLVCVNPLEQSSDGSTIISKLGGEQASETSVGQMLWLIDNGMLDTNKWYVFFIGGADGKFWAVRCGWLSGYSEWALEAYSLSNVWLAGYQIVSPVSQ
ncbi:MAG: hypothetical protein NTY30_01400 [Candidatus Berkelbacteria bacterium]|nr:hypothetical protein [Candidatus Berkelbacteria bacterium]